MSVTVAAAGISKSRIWRQRFVVGLLLGAVILTLGVLVWVIAYVALKGFTYLGPEFLTNNPPGNPSVAGGGYLNGILGSFIIVGVAAAIAIPIGLLTAVYITEMAHGRLARSISFWNDVLVGVPTIVIGAFIYAIWVTRFGFSGFAGSLALAIVMLPIIIRTASQMLALVPADLREASYALGGGQRQTILRVVSRVAAPGMVTGVMLAIARAMGETAPLLLTALGNDIFTELNPGHRMSTLSLQIFDSAISGFRAAQARAWAGALTLLLIVLALTMIARAFASRGTIRRS